jgi:hypothetical protein
VNVGKLLLNSKQFEQPLKLVCSNRLYYQRFQVQTIVLSIPETVPVNVGEAKLLFKSKAILSSMKQVYFITCIVTFQTNHCFINSGTVPCKVGEENCF